MTDKKETPPKSKGVISRFLEWIARGAGRAERRGHGPGQKPGNC
jgi:hypothetical protein